MCSIYSSLLYGYGSIPINTFFSGLFTSINPSYFDVNKKGVLLVLTHSHIFLYNYGKSPFLMGKSTISMAIFNSYVTNYQMNRCRSSSSKKPQICCRS